MSGLLSEKSQHDSRVSNLVSIDWLYIMAPKLLGIILMVKCLRRRSCPLAFCGEVCHGYLCRADDKWLLNGTCGAALKSYLIHDVSVYGFANHICIGKPYRVLHYRVLHYRVLHYRVLHYRVLLYFEQQHCLQCPNICNLAMRGVDVHKGVK